MLWLLALTAASANDLNFELTTDDGLSESWTKPAIETWAKQFGPVQADKKTVAKYLVNVSPSSFDHTEQAYDVVIGICREWVKGKKQGRDCSEETLLAPSEEAGPAMEQTRIKASDTWEYTIKVWFTGAAPQPETREPGPVEMPEPEPAGTVEVGPGQPE